ncbi:CPBP family intramembrane glutamic endopeptidase [Evansella tamaricis]|uniref:CPBP family intramembrane metalloprotease n=1 Tax=Evansella tamaricis TaxID=2069301 RepID=A0ABS6JN60_9BACI|nr:CPBP family intramembrane glutamic endopeptidase [Evansella tamaricis]MBU9714277.1 CPBP family intramembrane metalloprotease [Evansella tamaricis]
MQKQGELIKQLTDRELLLNLYITQLIILLLSLMLSRILFDSWFYPFQLIKWDSKDILIGFIAGVFVVILEIIAARVLPKHWFDDGGINERVFGNRSVLHIIILSTVVAVSEEILFRGVLQTYFGLIPAAIVFTVIHFRYLRKPFLLIVTVCLSFFIGYLYLYTGNLLTVIMCHLIIDMLLGLAIRFNFLNGGIKD